MLARARQASPSDTPDLDARVLLARVLGRPQSWVLAHPEYQPTRQEQRLFEAALRRIEEGEPLPYILGSWEFFGLEFYLTPQVLIPRPETELLVEAALAWLEASPARRRAADIGTGSGCIAVALARAVPGLQVYASDICRDALRLARINARAHSVAKQVHFAQMDLIAAWPGPFDLICANLPYIPTDVLRSLAVFAYEPALALDGGPDGLSLIRRLLLQAPATLSPGGLLLLEIEASQGLAALSLAQQAYPAATIQLQQDLAGADRLLRIQAAG